MAYRECALLVEVEVCAPEQCQGFSEPQPGRKKQREKMLVPMAAGGFEKPRRVFGRKRLKLAGFSFGLAVCSSQSARNFLPVSCALGSGSPR